MNSYSNQGHTAVPVGGGRPTSTTVLEIVLAFLLGLSPLAPLAIIGLLTTVLTTLARQLTESAGFYTQQWVAVILVALGLILAIAAVIVFSVHAFRTVRRWQQAGMFQDANAALFGLVVVSLVLVLPVVLAILAPQHPAPNLTA
jgi:hypothetical protein